MDKIMLGLKVMALGMGTVFAVLFIIFFILKIFEIVFGNMGSPKKESANSISESVAADTEPVSVEKNDDGELIAVITAAICAASGTSRSDFRIVSVQRKKTPWNRK